MNRNEIEARYGAVLSEHGQWVATATGLVGIVPDGMTDEVYFIDRREVTAATRESTIERMSEKRWVNAADLGAAFDALLASDPS